MAVRVKFTSKLPQWVSKQDRDNDIVVLKMATDIHRIAILNAPVATGTLIKSARINKRGQAHYAISFGNSSVRYARRRHYENRLHPDKLKYLERAGDSISRNFKRYYGAIR